MAKSENQKLKLLYLADLFRQKTDENHGVTIENMTDYLANLDIAADRKTLYKDMEDLRTYGMDIIMEKHNRKAYYKLLNRDFELAELKLLVDAVQSSKFITKKKTDSLNKKLGTLTSEYQAKELKRQFYIVEDLKNLNEKIYMIVDGLHRAINEDHQVEFLYNAWNIKKELVPRHNGKIYHVSPWGLTWDDENYYLVGYDEDELKIKHFRVDKMTKFSETDKSRNGKEEFEAVDMKEYGRKVFGMYSGKTQRVKLLVENNMIGIIFDRFGTDIMVMPQKDNKHVVVNVDVEVSLQFIGWLVGIGPGIKVIEPDEVCKQIRQHLDQMSALY